ncbi:hypothetical protein PoB_000926100 [Plakobranchus ocellatus]|uniref:Uncharacterized protein n=1 Tax=Plakobranchus ocellatus TaxID=259542 RepID=A0AAV3YHT6_9GAST|nr:hypothetical protein PoB_000926100 [Plakobranchus ocellatus]
MSPQFGCFIDKAENGKKKSPKIIKAVFKPSLILLTIFSYFALADKPADYSMLLEKGNDKACLVAVGLLGLTLALLVYLIVKKRSSSENETEPPSKRKWQLSEVSLELTYFGPYG